MWDEKAYPFLYINGCTVYEWMKDFIPHFIMDVITNPFWDWSHAILVKEALGVLMIWHINTPCWSRSKGRHTKLIGVKWRIYDSRVPTAVQSIKGCYICIFITIIQPRYYASNSFLFSLLVYQIIVWPFQLDLDWDQCFSKFSNKDAASDFEDTSDGLNTLLSIIAKQIYHRIPR